MRLDGEDGYDGRATFYTHLACLPPPLPPPFAPRVACAYLHAHPHLCPSPPHTCRAQFPFYQFPIYYSPHPTTHPTQWRHCATRLLGVMRVCFIAVRTIRHYLQYTAAHTAAYVYRTFCLFAFGLPRAYTAARYATMLRRLRRWLLVYFAARRDRRARAHYGSLRFLRDAHSCCCLRSVTHACPRCVRHLPARSDAPAAFPACAHILRSAWRAHSCAVLRSIPTFPELLRTSTYYYPLLYMARFALPVYYIYAAICLCALPACTFSPYTLFHLPYGSSACLPTVVITAFARRAFHSLGRVLLYCLPDSTPPPPHLSLVLHLLLHTTFAVRFLRLRALQHALHSKRVLCCALPFRVLRIAYMQFFTHARTHTAPPAHWFPLFSSHYTLLHCHTLSYILFLHLTLCVAYACAAYMYVCFAFAVAALYALRQGGEMRICALPAALLQRHSPPLLPPTTCKRALPLAFTLPHDTTPAHFYIHDSPSPHRFYLLLYYNSLL